MTESTRDKIKNVAFSLFANKGYEGTRMNEIAEGVGIKKASLYAHFNSKDEIFFTVFEDVAQKYKVLIDRLFNESEKMGIEERLAYIFEQYILYFYSNREEQGFWNQSTLFAPPNIKERFFPYAAEIEQSFVDKMAAILEESFQQGVVRKDNSRKMVMSFRALSEGIINTMHIIPSFKQEWIKDFWSDLWLGLKGREATYEKSEGV